MNQATAKKYGQKHDTAREKTILCINQYLAFLAKRMEKQASQ